MTLKKTVLLMGVVMAMAAVMVAVSSVAAVTGVPATYTLDADFDEGMLINVNHDIADQLQLNDTLEPFGFIWVAVSSKGTVVKIDTETGAVLGEYRTAPQGMGLNPSRTTVDLNGNVWVTNRNENGWVTADAIAPGIPATNRAMGSVVHIALAETGQCIDRDGSGSIDTSTGLGNVKPWSNTGGADTLGGVSTADDECIIHYTRVNSTGTRHVSVNGANDVWVGGIGARYFDLLDGSTGGIIRQEPSVGYGGYGGLIDGNGVIWSARPLLRWDTSLPLTGPNGVNWKGYSHDSYGLCIDSLGNVWNTALNGNIIRKFAPDGTLIGTYAHGSNRAQGCVVDGDDHVWVAHSLSVSNTVGHILNDGTYVGNVTVGLGPTGVAIDNSGKIWATNYDSGTVSRIDPTAGPIGADALTPVGAVDFTTVNLGGTLYNYSDMTGSTLTAPPSAGTWVVDHDTGTTGVDWIVSWNAYEPGDSSIVVWVASSADGVTYGPMSVVTNGSPISTNPTTQFLRVAAMFSRSSTDDDRDGINDSPILYDLTIESGNQPPDCSVAAPSVDLIWPPNHKFVPIDIVGVTDPDGDPISITIDSIYQDEPVDTYGDGRFTPDGQGVGTSTAEVRAERSGTKAVPGNGRVYHIGFTADDSYGGMCSGTVSVGVPHDQGQGATPIDEGPLYDSTAIAP